MTDNSRRTVITGFLWRFAERCGAQGTAFIVSVILARLLEPEDYGMIALVTVFTSILQVFVNSGFGGALIQKKNADDLDFSSVFYFNAVMCITMYILIFCSAPFIAGFYGQPQLMLVIRVSGLLIVISGVKNIQQAYVSRHMLFKKFFFSTLGGTLGAAATGIGMAYFGCGVWRLSARCWLMLWQIQLSCGLQQAGGQRKCFLLHGSKACFLLDGKCLPHRYLIRYTIICRGLS